MKQSRLIFFCVGWVVIASTASAADSLLRRDGRFLRLTTDLASADEAERLVESFDTALPQWIRFWNLDEQALTGFRVDAYVMRDPETFDQAGLIPREVPDFNFGYALGNRIWVKAQQSEYYTRHLVLHEGVHSLMFAAYGGAGPTWFQEGTAELLALHRGVAAALQINQIPIDREEVPYWGRFKLMGQLRGEGKIPSLQTVMRYQPNLSGDVGAYSWSWAAVMILQAYPEYRSTLLAAAQNGSTVGPGFNRQLLIDLEEQLPILAARWRLMCHDLDYGFDWSRERVELSIRDPLWSGNPMRVSVAADRGWQSVGFRIPRGVSIRLRPSGEVTLATTSRAWTSQPQGITLQYHRGRPLGQLLVCVLPNAMQADADYLAPLPVQSVTEETVIEVPDYSWLLFRVNDAVDQLGDNQGEYEVSLEVDRRR